MFVEYSDEGRNGKSAELVPHVRHAGRARRRAHSTCASVPGKIPLPASLAGKRVLDAAAADGFWSFVLAERGADEVVSLDLGKAKAKDWQGMQTGEGVDGDRPRRAFDAVRTAKKLENVTRVDMNLYDINPDDLGTFDFVFIGSVLLHLQDPSRALRAIKSVLKPEGELFSFEPISLTLSVVSRKMALGQLWDLEDRSRWWTPNMAGHRRIVQSAGYQIIDSGGPVFQPFGTRLAKWPEKFPRKPRQLLFWLFVRRFGVASQWVRARPRS